MTSKMTHITVILLTTALTTCQMTDVVGDDIINGKKVPKNSLQYMVSVQVNEEHVCGGFLIASEYVLTAAHCERENMTVVIGDHNIDPQKNLQRYELVRKFTPKTYQDANMGDDIMLLKISGKAKATVKIPYKNNHVKYNTECLIAGWGRTKWNKRVHDLLSMNVLTVARSDCSMVWQKRQQKIPPNVICAEGNKQNGGICLGDSGGPLVCDSVAVGVISFNRRGSHCKYPDVPNIFTDISKYADWIKKKMKK